jgi:hypothetical protein
MTKRFTIELEKMIHKDDCPENIKSFLEREKMEFVGRSELIHFNIESLDNDEDAHLRDKAIMKIVEHLHHPLFQQITIRPFEEESHEGN